jgi:hypothetical protein
MKKIVFICAFAAVATTATAQQADTFETRWNAMFRPTDPIEDWQIIEQPPVLDTHALVAPVISDPAEMIAKYPFMTALDPDGVITRSPVPLHLYPKEWSAMAKDGSVPLKYENTPE